MKHRAFLLLLGMMVGIGYSSHVLAQGKWGADSARAIQEYSLYLEYAKQKDYATAYPHWQWLVTHAPRVNEGLYIRGARILKHLIKTEKDPQRKARLIDSLLALYDQRIHYFNKRPDNLARKAADLLKYRPKEIDSAYAWLKEALQGNTSIYSAPYYFIVSAVKRVKAQKQTKEELMADYQLAMQVVDHYLAQNGKKKEKWQQSADKVNKLMAPYLDCESIESALGPTFRQRKDDTVFVKKFIRLLEVKKCQDPIYAEALEAYVAQTADAASLRKLGRYLIKSGRADEALKMFNTYKGRLNDPNDQAVIELSIADVYREKGQYAAAKRHIMAALRLRPDYGAAYLMLGDVYVAGHKTCGDEFAQKAVYWVAVDKYMLARSKDPSIADEANKRIRLYQKYFPSKEDIFFHMGGNAEGKPYQVKCWINETTTVRPRPE